ncbi:hypothetical protein LY16_02445 [Xenorhabdus doucetiae]|uniref:Transposase n=1 Tax=Xenorhabdus doucetiae TaxID=351671 RepID=A0ABY3NPU8_9GAMM|nr:hypothetical protein LY16_02445 [Xenorhabdus doucetiae]
MTIAAIHQMIGRKRTIGEHDRKDKQVLIINAYKSNNILRK